MVKEERGSEERGSGALFLVEDWPWSSVHARVYGKAEGVNGVRYGYFVSS
jgi:hypothetical protein